MKIFVPSLKMYTRLVGRFSLIAITLCSFLGTPVREASAANESGWTDDGNVVRLTTASDKVGIGTDKPEVKLHVVGQSKFYVDGNERVEITTPGGWPGIVGYSTPAGQLYGKSEKRRDIIFGNAGLRLLTSPTSAPPKERNGIWIKNDGVVQVKVLEITGGSDLAEPFAIAKSKAIQPGLVVSIDPDNPGQLRLSKTAYDRTVAGIVSGAKGLNPGLKMKKMGSLADGTLPVSLTGRVYCFADASNTPISPGDLLTTSNIPGHAMKVTDHAKAQGAIIGKAMTPLASGKGLVFVLVSLQ